MQPLRKETGSDPFVFPRCDGEPPGLSGFCEVRDPSFHRSFRGMSPHHLHGTRPERNLSKGPAGRISHRPRTPIALRSADQPRSPNRYHYHSLRRRSTSDLRAGQSEILLAGCVGTRPSHPPNDRRFLLPVLIALLGCIGLISP